MFKYLFYTGNWPPRWRCGTWSEALGWVHISSELLIWGAYMMIPILILYFVKKRKDIPLPGIFFLFAAFIISCGFTHLIEAIIFYYPIYRFLGLMLVITAIVSWLTVFSLIPVLPKLLALPSLEGINSMLKRDVVVTKEKYQHLLTLVDASTFEWESTSDNLQVSDGFCKILNISPSSCHTMSDFFDLLHYEDKPILENLFKGLDTKEGVQSQRLRFVSEDNVATVLLIKWMVSPDTGQGKKIFGVLMK